MTTPNDPLNGSTPPDVLARALSGQLAADAGGDSIVAPSDAPTAPEAAPEPPAATPEPTPAPATARTSSSNA